MAPTRVELQPKILVTFNDLTEAILETEIIRGLL